MIVTIACIVYGAMCGDRQWMPRPDLNFMSWGFGFAVIFGMMALASGICFFLEARKAFDELMRRDEEYTRAVLEMSQATFPMSQSYGGAPSYAPSYGGGVGDYSAYGSDEKKAAPQPSYSTQPSYGGQSGVGYDSKPAAGYDTSGYGGGNQGGGYGGSQSGYGGGNQSGYGAGQSGYGGSQSGYAGSQSGYGDSSQPSYGQSSYGAKA